VKKRRVRVDRFVSMAGRVARFLVKSQLLTIFLGLTLLGVIVGAFMRPDPDRTPYDELFDGMGVQSYRESPADTSARFVVQLSAGGRMFSEYDVDAQRFLPPARGRHYGRTITGTTYRPLEARGHVAQGLWLEIPDSASRAPLAEQFDELYRSTLDFVKPVSSVTGVLGVVSGYSVGYRIGAWHGSLASRRMQTRLLSTPDLGRTMAREAWRRVALEPVLMIDPGDPERFAAARGAHRLYTNFFRLALSDSDGFIPREAARLDSLGRTVEARDMRAFVAAVRRAAEPSTHLASEDFAAVERWASLLERRGHWASDAIPATGEERIRYLGTLAWYGIAPTPPDVERVWVGARMLVREGDSEGFITDEILVTGVGCPIAWRARLSESPTGAAAVAHAWLDERPEFAALATLGTRIGNGGARTARGIAAWWNGPAKPRPAEPRRALAAAVEPLPIPAAPAADGADDESARPLAYPFEAHGTEGTIVLVTEDSTAGAGPALAARRTIEFVGATLERWKDAIERPGPSAPVETGVADPVLALQRALAERVARDTAMHLPDPDRDAVTMDWRATAWGWAMDAAADTLRARRAAGALVAVANAAIALGQPGDGERWGVGLYDPRGAKPTYARIGLAAGRAIATTHATDARVSPAAPGGVPNELRIVMPDERFLSVTVVAPSAMAADVWSAALMVMDKAEAKRRAKERPDLAVVIVEHGPDGIDTVWIEPELRDHFTLDAAARDRFRLEAL
jgi:hypothetical protein